MSDHRIHWQPGVEEIVAREVGRVKSAVKDRVDKFQAFADTTISAEDRELYQAIADDLRLILADPEEKP